MKRYGMIIFLLCCFSLMVSCEHVPAYIKNPNIQLLTSYQKHLLGKIEKSGIQVIKQGMLFTFSIPTDRFFANDTRALKRHRSKDIFVLAQFLESYRQYFSHPEIAVAGFTDKVWLYPERKLLSVHYAQIVASYLSQGGVSSSIVRVNGYGAKAAIASNRYPTGTMYNRRVVVVIR